jgi:hypothetical protein
VPWLGTPDNHGYRRPACWCPVKMSLLSTRDDTARGLSSEPRSGRGERQDFVASAVVLDKVRQLCLDKFNVSLGGGLDRSRAASSASGISGKTPSRSSQLARKSLISDPYPSIFLPARARAREGGMVCCRRRSCRRLLPQHSDRLHGRDGEAAPSIGPALIGRRGCRIVSISRARIFTRAASASRRWRCLGGRWIGGLRWW